MSRTAGAAESLEDTERPGVRLWERGVVVHAAAYLVLLLGLLAVGTASSSFTSDEGAYLLQVRLVDEGTWAFDYPLAQQDPEGTYFPIINSDQGDQQWFPYVKHPLYVRMLDLSIDAFGLAFGAHVWSIIGAVGGALAAWYLAQALDPRLARGAFWIAALSPLLANSQMVWAHAPSTALGGFAALVALLVVRDRRFTAASGVGLALLLGFGVLLRAEGLLWAGALLAALGLFAVLRKRWAWLVGCAAVAVAPVAAFVVQRQWRIDIVGGAVSSVPESSTSAGSWIGERISGTAHVLIEGDTNEPGASLLLLVALVLVLLAGLSWRARRPPAQAQVLVTVALGLYVLRLVLYSLDPIPGLFAAWPIFLLGLVVAKPRQLPTPLAVVAGAAGLFTAVVIVTQWDTAGGVQWGGRYLSPALAVFGALTAFALDRARSDDAPARRFPMQLVVALVVVPAVLGAVVPERVRAMHVDLVADALAAEVPVVISGQGAIPRLAWESTVDTDWYRLPEDEPLGPLLDDLDEAGVREVGVVSVPVDDADLGSWEVDRRVGGIDVLVLRD